MTPQEAKEVTLEVWGYLKEHPEIRRKRDLPDELWEKIYYIKQRCPLCELYWQNGAVCPRCPLKNCAEGSPFMDWLHAYCSDESFDIRRDAATKIVETLKAWEPEKETGHE